MVPHEKCNHFLDSISEYIDGSLSEGLCEEIERHIANCDDCRVVVDTLEKTIYLYHTTTQDDPEIPEDVRDRLFKRLNLDEFIQDSPEK